MDAETIHVNGRAVYKKNNGDLVYGDNLKRLVNDSLVKSGRLSPSVLHDVNTADTSGGVQMTFASDGYLVNLFKTGSLYTIPISSPTLPNLLTDSVIEMDLRVIRGNGYVVLGCRGNETQGDGYRLAYAPATGAYQITKATAGNLTVLASGTHPPVGPGPKPEGLVIPSSEFGQIALTCIGPKIMFSIHFDVVGTGQDTTYTRGSVWLAAGATQASPSQSTQLEFRGLQIEGR
jgi:hypothetical protein